MWCVNGTVAKVALKSGGLTPERLSEVRAAGSALLLSAIVLVTCRETARVTRREIPSLVVFGILGLAFVQYFYFVAIKRLDIGIGLVIMYTAPVLVALWARFFEHEPVRRRLWFALALALAGLSLVVDVWGGVTLDGLGVASCLAAAVSYAVYIVMAAHALRRGRNALSLLAWGFLFASVFWLVVAPPWSFPTDRLTESASLLGRLEDVRLPVWLLLGYVVLFGSVVPFIFIVTSLRYLSATRTIVLAMLEPVGAALVAYAWLGEELSAGQIVGAVLVLAGILVAQTARVEPIEPAPALRALEERA